MKTNAPDCVGPGNNVCVSTSFTSHTSVAATESTCLTITSDCSDDECQNQNADGGRGGIDCCEDENMITYLNSVSALPMTSGSFKYISDEDHLIYHRDEDISTPPNPCSSPIMAHRLKKPTVTSPTVTLRLQKPTVAARQRVSVITFGSTQACQESDSTPHTDQMSRSAMKFNEKSKSRRRHDATVLKPVELCVANVPDASTKSIRCRYDPPNRQRHLKRCTGRLNPNMDQMNVPQNTCLGNGDIGDTRLKYHTEAMCGQADQPSNVISSIHASDTAPLPPIKKQRSHFEDVTFGERPHRSRDDKCTCRNEYGIVPVPPISDKKMSTNKLLSDSIACSNPGTIS